MKQIHQLRNSALHRLFAAAAVLAAATIHIQAQSWETILTLNEPAMSFGHTLLVDPASSNPSIPNVYVGGKLGDLGAIVLLNQEDPVDRLTVSDPEVLESGGTEQLGFDASSGQLFAVGWDSPLWRVRKKDVAGGAWTTDDTYSLGSGNGAWATGFAADGQGNVFVCGEVRDASNYAHWIVRRWNIARGWETVQDLSGRRENHRAKKMHFSNGHLFVVGNRGVKWAVQRGSNLADAKVTWEEVDSWTPKKNQTAAASAITSDGAGSIYVFGSTLYKWIVRKSQLNGAPGSFQTETELPLSYDARRPNGIAFDRDGNLYLVGGIVVGATIETAKYQWAIRQRDPSGTWHPVEYPFLSSPGGTSIALAIETDSEGNVFVIGGLNSQATVQRLSF